MSPNIFPNAIASSKQQAASSKQQAASSKQQAASSKQQAASSKQQVSRSVRGCLRTLALWLCLAPILSVSAFAQSAPENVVPITNAFAATLQKIPYAVNTHTYTTQWNITNHWNFPLQVERFDTSCGCLVGKMESKPIAPGASGILYTTMTPGNHRGLLRKSLHVRFVGHKQAVELISEIHIPSTVELSRQEIIWPRGNTTTQTLDVTTGTDTPFTITGLLGVPEQFFTITQETITPSKHYRLSITPQGMRDNAAHCLQIRTDSPDPRDQVVALFLRSESAPANPPR